MHEEKRYDFKKELLEIHKSGLRNKNAAKKDNEVEISDGFQIAVFEGASAVVINAVKDFQDFLFKSMDVCSTQKGDELSVPNGQIQVVKHRFTVK